MANQSLFAHLCENWSVLNLPLESQMHDIINIVLEEQQTIVAQAAMTEKEYPSRKRPAKMVRFAALTDSEKTAAIRADLLARKTPLQVAILSILNKYPQGLFLAQIRADLPANFVSLRGYENLPFDNYGVTDNLSLVGGHVAHTLNRMLLKGFVAKIPAPLPNGKVFGKKPLNHLWQITPQAKAALK
jgi:hypothetical protein